MSARSILLTGAGGFVGQHLLAAFGREFPDAALHQAAFDVTEPADIRAAIQALHPDVCIHLAAVSTVASSRQQPDVAWRVNLQGTLHLARAILDLAPRCVLIFASSAEAYGRSFAQGTALDETAMLAPMNTYAATKAAADLAVGAMAFDGLRVIRLRPFNHTGPGQSDAFMVAAFSQQLARIEADMQPPVLSVGSLDPQRDFLDVRDVCAAYAACVSRMDDLQSGVIVNIASGIPRRVGDVLDDLIALSGLRVEVKIDPGRVRRTEIVTAAGSAARASQLLAWKPRIAWEQTLLDVLNDWRQRIRA